MRTCVVLLACLVSQVTCAAASTPLPKSVQTALDQVAAVCSESEGKPIMKDAIKRADLNADGHEDYVLDVGSVVCDGAASIYGDREKGVLVYVGDGKGGAVEAFNGSSFGIRLDGTGSAAKLWLSVMGADCGKKPAASFAEENFCERPLQWSAGTRKFEFAPVSTVRKIE
jgi:hypothetical protein